MIEVNLFQPSETILGAPSLTPLANGLPAQVNLNSVDCTWISLLPSGT